MLHLILQPPHGRWHSCCDQVHFSTGPHQVQRKRQTGNVTAKDRQKRDRDTDEHVPPAQDTVRRFAQLPNQVVPSDFDAPLPESEVAAWEGKAGGEDRGDPSDR